MNSKIKKTFQNISYSVLANGINTFITMVLVFIIPKALGLKEYSYWQLYTFYVSYTGFFHFGWADGVYLKFGGENYEELDKRYFGRQFWLLAILEIIIACGVGFFAYLCVDDSSKSVVLLLTGVCCVLQIPRTFLQYVLQATSKIKEYAKNYMLEKAIYAICVLTMLFLVQKSFVILISADLIARLVTLILLCIQCRDIVLIRIDKIGDGLREAWENISAGNKLMFANIAGLLLTGILRFAIENHWSVEEFGKVSLTMTASNLLMGFINAVSIVIYPMLRGVSKERLPQVYANLRISLMIPVLGLLIVYYPAKVFLSNWLPQYAESLRYMALLFPMCVYESKMSLLINTYLKALRKEKAIMYINWISVGFTVLLTGITVYVLDNMTLSIMTLTLLLAFRCIIAELYLAKQLGVSVIGSIVVESILAIVFITSSWYIQSWLSTLIYAVAYVGYLIVYRKGLASLLNRLKNVFGGRKVR